MINISSQQIAKNYNRIPVHRKADLLVPRQSFGVCVINPYIYAIGGMSVKKRPLASVERYNLLTDSWEVVKDMTLPQPLFSMNVFQVEKRIIYLFGAMVADRVKKTEFILRFDTRNMSQGWSSFDLEIDPGFGKGC